MSAEHAHPLETETTEAVATETTTTESTGEGVANTEAEPTGDPGDPDPLPNTQPELGVV